MGAKPIKAGKQPSKKQPADSKQATQAKVQAILQDHIAEFGTDSGSEQESDQKQLDVDILLNMESDNE